MKQMSSMVSLLSAPGLKAEHHAVVRHVDFEIYCRSLFL